VDIGGAELQRLVRVREKQDGPRFELVLGVAALARRLGDSAVTIEAVRDAAAKLTSAAAELAASSRAGAEKNEIVTIREAVQTLDVRTSQCAPRSAWPWQPPRPSL